MLDTIWRDLRYAARSIWKGRWFTLAAIGALALGIAVNGFGFTIVNTAFIKGTGVKDAERLVVPCLQLRDGVRCSMSAPELQDWRAGSRSIAEFGAWDTETANLSDDQGVPEQVPAVGVTANLFAMLGYAPALGRPFAAEDDRAEADPVVLIGHDLWNRRYGGDPGVLGRTLRLNGKTAAIVGVMPPGMRFPDTHEIWAPWTPFHREAEHQRQARGLTIVGRLRDGVTAPDAEADLNDIARQAAAAEPAGDVAGVFIEPFSNRFGLGQARNVFIAVMGAVCFVLLIACANVANLLLSRSSGRTREMAVRLSLGATRWGLVRLLLFESLLLAAIGGALGFLLTAMLVPLFEAALPADKPYWLVFAVDYTVIAYVAGLCGLTAVLCGLAPAVTLSKDAASTLKDNARGSHGGRRSSRIHAALAVTELTLSLVLLVGAGLMTRSFFNIYGLDLGFPTDRLVLFGMDLIGPRYETPSARQAFVEQLESRVTTIPGVEAAAITTDVPPRNIAERLIDIDNGPSPQATVSMVAITPRFFPTLGVPLLRGRNLTDADGPAGAENIVINQRMAEQYFPGRDPLGARLRFRPFRPQPGQAPEQWRTIVGVVPTIRQGSLNDAYLNAVVYTPYRENAYAGAYLVIRSAVPLGTISDTVRKAVQEIDRDQPLRFAQTLDQWIAAESWPVRLFGGVFAMLAAIALVLSAVGLYAVMAYAVSRRTQEIGVRMAIGAERRQIAWLVLRRGLWQLGLSLTLGTLAALLLGQILAGLLVDVSPADPQTFAAVALLLTLVSLAACLIPAWRAAHVDPAITLRDS